MTGFARHDRVVVVDPHDRYAGEHGQIVEIHLGLITGLPVITVQLDDAQRSDGFYAEQLEFENHPVLQVAA